MKAIFPSMKSDLTDWYFVWDWWPVPQFLFLLLGADGCRAFVNALNKSDGENRLLVSFALAIENRRVPIMSEGDLEEALTTIYGPSYDFGSAKELESEVANCKWTNIVQKNGIAQVRTPLTSDSPEALRRDMAAKNLPLGRVENLALMRAILAARTDARTSADNRKGDMRYGDFMRPLDLHVLELSDEMRADVEVERFIELYDRTLRAEKVSDPDDWTPEQKSAYKCENFRVFSQLRGYSEQEILDFSDYLASANALTAKYGEDDVAWIGYTIQEHTGVLGMTPEQMLAASRSMNSASEHLSVSETRENGCEKNS